MYGNHLSMIGSQRKLLKGYSLNPKFCPNCERKTFPDVLETITQHTIAIGSFMKQLVVHLKSDPNYIKRNEI